MQVRQFAASSQNDGKLQEMNADEMMQGTNEDMAVEQQSAIYKGLADVEASQLSAHHRKAQGDHTASDTGPSLEGKGERHIQGLRSKGHAEPNVLRVERYAVGSNGAPSQSSRGNVLVTNASAATVTSVRQEAKAIDLTLSAQGGMPLHGVRSGEQVHEAKGSRHGQAGDVGMFLQDSSRERLPLGTPDGRRLESPLLRRKKWKEKFIQTVCAVTSKMDKQAESGGNCSHRCLRALAVLHRRDLFLYIIRTLLLGSILKPVDKNSVSFRF